MARTLAQVDDRLTAEIYNRAAADKALTARIDALTARVALLETPVPPTSTPPPPTPTPPPGQFPTLLGFGSKALDWLPSVPDTIIKSPADYLAAFPHFGDTVHWAQLQGSWTADLGAVIHKLSGRSNFFVDGRGADVTFRNGNQWFEVCLSFAFANVRDRGGWAAGQNADNFTNVASHDFAYLNVSASGSYDEGISSTRGCSNYSLQDCLLGMGGDANHNFGSLNYGHTADRNGPGSFIRNAWFDKDYRNPKIGYRGDPADGSPNSSAPDPGPITADVVNNILVDCNYGLTASLGAKVNNTAPYLQNTARPQEVITGASVGTFTVPLWAAVPAMTPVAAARYAKTNAGALPHDATDAGLVGRITA